MHPFNVVKHCFLQVKMILSSARCYTKKGMRPSVSSKAILATSLVSKNLCRIELIPRILFQVTVC